MNYFSDQDLLGIWEYGLNHDLLETNLFLLSHAYPQYSRDQIASFSIGERDVRLLHIREKLFGTVLQNTSNCKACSQKIEWEVPVNSLYLQPISEELMDTSITHSYDNHEISFRPPNSRDILETKGETTHETQVQALIQKCIVTTTLPLDQIEHMPDDLKAELIQKMEEKDPQANIVMKLSCPDCDHNWEAFFDIMEYLWSEISNWAVQLLKDVYLLASKFNWSEKDILEMSRLRRNLYLNMINK